MAPSQARQAQKAENEAIEQCMGLVVRALQKLNISGSGRDDAMQIGRMAVMEAIRTYDPDHGAKLTTWVYSKVTWRVKDWMDSETRMRRGRPFVQTHGAEGNEAKDWAPKKPNEKPPGIVGSGDDFTDLCYPQLADKSDAPSDIGEAAESEASSLETRRTVAEALALLPERLQRAAAGLAQGCSVDDLAEELGVSRATAARARADLRTALAYLKEELER